MYVNFFCKTCELKVTGKDKGIQCEICQGWWHCRCEKINEEGYKLLNMENIHWFCSACNSIIGRILPTLTKLEINQIKLEEELKTITADVSDMKKKLQTLQKDIENVKKETFARTSKLELGHEAVKEDIKILNQKIDEGIKQCVADSDKMVKSLQHKTRAEIKDEIEEMKTTSFADTKKEELEKSLGNMATELETVKTNIIESKVSAEEQCDKESISPRYLTSDGLPGQRIWEA